MRRDAVDLTHGTRVLMEGVVYDVEDAWGWIVFMLKLVPSKGGGEFALLTKPGYVTTEKSERHETLTWKRGSLFQYSDQFYHVVDAVQAEDHLRLIAEMIYVSGWCKGCDEKRHATTLALAPFNENGEASASSFETRCSYCLFRDVLEEFADCDPEERHWRRDSRVTHMGMDKPPHLNLSEAQREWIKNIMGMPVDMSWHEIMDRARKDRNDSG